MPDQKDPLVVGRRNIHFLSRFAPPSPKPESSPGDEESSDTASSSSEVSSVDTLNLNLVKQSQGISKLNLDERTKKRLLGPIFLPHDINIDYGDQQSIKSAAKNISKKILRKGQQEGDEKWEKVVDFIKARLELDMLGMSFVDDIDIRIKLKTDWLQTKDQKLRTITSKNDNLDSSGNTGTAQISLGELKEEPGKSVFINNNRTVLVSLNRQGNLHCQFVAFDDAAIALTIDTLSSYKTITWNGVKDDDTQHKIEIACAKEGKRANCVSREPSILMRAMRDPNDLADWARNIYMYTPHTDEDSAIAVASAPYDGNKYAKASMKDLVQRVVGDADEEAKDRIIELWAGLSELKVGMTPSASGGEEEPELPAENTERIAAISNAVFDAMTQKQQEWVKSYKHDLEHSKKDEDEAPHATQEQALAAQKRVEEKLEEIEVTMQVSQEKQKALSVQLGELDKYTLQAEEETHLSNLKVLVGKCGEILFEIKDAFDIQKNLYETQYGKHSERFHSNGEVVAGCKKIMVQLEDISSGLQDLRIRQGEANQVLQDLFRIERKAQEKVQQKAKEETERNAVIDAESKSRTSIAAESETSPKDLHTDFLKEKEQIELRAKRKAEEEQKAKEGTERNAVIDAESKSRTSIVAESETSPKDLHTDFLKEKEQIELRAKRKAEEEQKAKEGTERNAVIDEESKSRTSIAAESETSPKDLHTDFLKEKEQIELKAKEAEEALQKLVEQLETTNTQVTKTTTHLKEVHGQHEERTKQQTALAAQLQAFHADNDTEAKVLERKIEEINQQLEAVKQQIVKNGTQIEVLLTKIKVLQDPGSQTSVAEIENLTQQCTTTQTTLQKLNENLVGITKELEEVKTQQDDISKRLAQSLEIDLMFDQIRPGNIDAAFAKLEATDTSSEEKAHILRLLIQYQKTEGGKQEENLKLKENLSIKAITFLNKLEKPITVTSELGKLYQSVKGLPAKETPQRIKGMNLEEKVGDEIKKKPPSETALISKMYRDEFARLGLPTKLQDIINFLGYLIVSKDKIPPKGSEGRDAIDQKITDLKQTYSNDTSISRFTEMCSILEYRDTLDSFKPIETSQRTVEGINAKLDEYYKTALKLPDLTVPATTKLTLRTDSSFDEQITTALQTAGITDGLPAWKLKTIVREVKSRGSLPQSFLAKFADGGLCLLRDHVYPALTAKADQTEQEDSSKNPATVDELLSLLPSPPPPTDQQKIEFLQKTMKFMHDNLGGIGIRRDQIAMLQEMNKVVTSSKAGYTIRDTGFGKTTMARFFAECMLDNVKAIVTISPVLEHDPNVTQIDSMKKLEEMMNVIDPPPSDAQSSKKKPSSKLSRYTVTPSLYSALLKEIGSWEDTNQNKQKFLKALRENTMHINDEFDTAYGLEVQKWFSEKGVTKVVHMSATQDLTAQQFKLERTEFKIKTAVYDFNAIQKDKDAGGDVKHPEDKTGEKRKERLASKKEETAKSISELKKNIVAKLVRSDISIVSTGKTMDQIQVAPDAQAGKGVLILYPDKTYEGVKDLVGKYQGENVAVLYRDAQGQRLARYGDKDIPYADFKKQFAAKEPKPVVHCLYTTDCRGGDFEEFSRNEVGQDKRVTKLNIVLDNVKSISELYQIMGRLRGDFQSVPVEIYLTENAKVQLDKLVTEGEKDSLLTEFADEYGINKESIPENLNSLLAGAYVQEKYEANQRLLARIDEKVAGKAVRVVLQALEQHGETIINDLVKDLSPASSDKTEEGTIKNKLRKELQEVYKEVMSEAIRNFHFDPEKGLDDQYRELRQKVKDDFHQRVQNKYEAITEKSIQDEELRSNLFTFGEPTGDKKKPLYVRICQEVAEQHKANENSHPRIIDLWMKFLKERGVAINDERDAKQYAAETILGNKSPSIKEDKKWELTYNPQQTRLGQAGYSTSFEQLFESFKSCKLPSKEEIEEHNAILALKTAVNVRVKPVLMTSASPKNNDELPQSLAYEAFKRDVEKKEELKAKIKDLPGIPHKEVQLSSDVTTPSWTQPPQQQEQTPSTSTKTTQQKGKTYPPP